MSRRQLRHYHRQPWRAGQYNCHLLELSNMVPSLGRDRACAAFANVDCRDVSDICWCGIRVAFSRSLFWVISFCLRSLIYCQLASNDTLSSASRPHTSWDRVARDVVWTVEFIAFRHAASTPDQPNSGSRSYLSLICLVRIMLASVWWHCSIMEFACGFLLVIIVRCTPHSLLSKSATSSANSLPLSMTISVGHGCWVSQLISKWLAM